MNVETVTINNVAHQIQALKMRKLRGDPLTFDELTALERAAWLSGETVTKEGRVPVRLSGEVLIAKSAPAAAADALLEVVKSAAPGDSMRSAAWRQIEKLGEQLRAHDRSLTREQASIKAMDLPEAAPYVALYRDRNAGDDVAQFVAKGARRLIRAEKIGAISDGEAHTWADVRDQQVEKYMAADTRDVPREMKRADAIAAFTADYPDMARCYDDERAGRL